MKIVNTGDPQNMPSVVMLVYGDGGVGKSTFASTAPKPFMADCENGSKYFGLRGIKMDVAHIEKWSDMRDFLDAAKKGGYETIVIDPLGELMGKLKRHMLAMSDRKLVQPDGTPSMAGWGWLKSTMRDYLKVVRDTGMHVLLIAHVDPVKDEDRVMMWPLIETKISEELVNMVDIVGYMMVVNDEGKEDSKRVILIDTTPGSKYKSKDRSGQLGKVIEPDFLKIIKAIQGTETYSWSKKADKPQEPKGNEVKDGSMTEKIVDTFGGEVILPESKKPEAETKLSEARKKMEAGKQAAMNKE